MKLHMSGHSLINWICCTGIAAAFLIILLGLIGASVTVYLIIVSIFGGYVLCNEIYWRKSSRQEEHCAELFASYLSEVRHGYYSYGMVEEALYSAVDRIEPELREEAGRFYEIVSAPDSEKALAVYRKEKHNKLYDVYLMVCMLTAELGDGKKNGYSVFLDNLGRLKEEVREYARKLREARYRFGGLTFLTVFPLFILHWIEEWGIVQLPDLVLYYSGWYGVLVRILLILLSGSLYFLICWFRSQEQTELGGSKKDRLENEVVELQMILSMLIYLGRISAFDLLHVMEEFSVLLKEDLMECLNRYQNGEESALERLREKTNCTSFHSLVDNLMMCDLIGVEKAMEETIQEREYLLEKKKQRGKQRMEQQAEAGRMLSFLPLFGAIGLYLIIPFLAESMQQLLTLTAEMG